MNKNNLEAAYLMHLYNPYVVWFNRLICIICIMSTECYFSVIYLNYTSCYLHDYVGVFLQNIFQDIVFSAFMILSKKIHIICAVWKFCDKLSGTILM